MNVVTVNDNSRTRIEDFVAVINGFFDLVLCPGSLFGHGLQKEICTYNCSGTSWLSSPLCILPLS
jgi:hypothetical protein